MSAHAANMVTHPSVVVFLKYREDSQQERKHQGIYLFIFTVRSFQFQVDVPGEMHHPVLAKIERFR